MMFAPRHKPKFAFAIALATLLLGLASETVSAATPLVFADCRLTSSHRGVLNSRCAWFDVAENRDAPQDKGQSKHIQIRVALMKSLRKSAARDPIFVVSGGPGQAASDFYLSYGAAFEQLRGERDVVIVDQRGTGQSQRLDCELPDELESARFDKATLQRYVKQCLSNLPGDSRYYTTSVAVRDLEDIRTAMGYEKINLYGISYGTRVVQHYMRRYPQNVRAAVLDGVVPTTTILGPEIGPAAQASLDVTLARCASQKSCQQAFPHVADDFKQLRARLAAAPISINVADPRTSIVAPMEFGAEHLAVAVRLLSYADDTAALLPFLIHEAANGRPQVMATQALMVARRVGDQMATGMNNAVVCTEDVPFFDAHALADPAIAQSYLGHIFVDALQATCEIWPKGVMDADFHAPLQSDVPVLIFSGQNDPVTSAAYGEQASKSFKNGKHIVFPGQGHGQITLRCGASLFNRFIRSGTVAALNTDCVARVMPAAFMLNANTPGP